MKEFKVGGVYWGIRAGWGMESVVQVKLKRPIYNNNSISGYAADDVGHHAVAGTAEIALKNLFHSKDDAEAARGKMVQDRIKAMTAETDTPEKMLNYLLKNIYDCERDGHVEWQAKKNLEKRARKMFGMEG